MKFELEPDNRNCPDSVLLADLRRVAEGLGRNTLTKDEYEAKGRFGGATFERRFGAWNKALARSGLEVAHPKNIPKKELIEDLKCVSSKLGKASVTAEEYRLHGKFSVDAFSRACGSWKRGLQEAGLNVSPNYHERATDEELLENLGRVWEQLGRQPRMKDFERPLSRFGYDNYPRRFG